MSAKKEPETNEQYYGPLVVGWPYLNHERGRVRYGQETEPPDGKAKKTRVVRTKDLRKIQFEFLALLDQDILKNSALSWVFRSPLPSKENKRQPLGDYPAKP